MRILNSRFYGMMETISVFFLLNLFWILFSLPIITIFPATAALFAMVRDFSIGRNTSLFQTYIKYFRAYFKQSFVFGLAFFAFATIIYIDFMIIDELNTVMRVLVFSVLLLLGAILMFISIYLFPVIVHFQSSLKSTVKNAFFYSIMYFPTTTISIFLLAAVGLLVFLMPILSLIAFSVTAHVIFLLCHRNFKKGRKLSVDT